MDDKKHNYSYYLGEELRKLRRSRSMSQEDVALEADITTSYLGLVERGKRNITVHLLEKVCDALDVTLSEFFSNVVVNKSEKNSNSDEISRQILHQWRGKTESEKQAVLKMLKLVFSMQEMKVKKKQ